MSEDVDPEPERAGVEPDPRNTHTHTHTYTHARTAPTRIRRTRGHRRADTATNIYISGQSTRCLRNGRATTQLQCRKSGAAARRAVKGERRVQGHTGIAGGEGGRRGVQHNTGGRALHPPGVLVGVGRADGVAEDGRAPPCATWPLPDMSLRTLAGLDLPAARRAAPWTGLRYL